MAKIQNPSLPKDRIKFLLLEGVSQTAVHSLGEAGYVNVERRTKALDGKELIAALDGVRVLGIRSRSQITREVVEAAGSLMAVGCFSVGTNQIDLDAARLRGVPVFNAPFSNTRSVAELTMAEIVILFRRIFPRSAAAHKGGWDKSATGSREVRGKTLGIVGYGNIGTQLAVLAEAMGLRVIYHDQSDKLRHGNVEPAASLDDLLARSDVVSLHVPETPETHGMIGAREIGLMKKGAFLINNSRGTVVDLEAMAAAVREDRLGGGAIDVFPVEPSSNADPFESPLQGLGNVILTPHVGGSTEEAQERIGEEVTRKLIEYSDVGSTDGAVNFPEVRLPPRTAGTRFIQVQRNLPGELGKLNEVFARHGVNIAAQYYQTDGEVGYVVLDADEARPNRRRFWPRSGRFPARSGQDDSTGRPDLPARPASVACRFCLAAADSRHRLLMVARGCRRQTGREIQEGTYPMPDSTETRTLTAADHAKSMEDYIREGEARARGIGNRGPIRLDAGGKLEKEILDDYWLHGFYIFEGVVDPTELEELRADADRVLEGAPIAPDADVDAKGRPAIGHDFASPAFTLERPLSDPVGGTTKNNGRHPARMLEPALDADGPAWTVARLRGNLQLMESALRLYGHPGLLAVADAVNGPDFVPFNEVTFVKEPGLGPSVAWHRDGTTHWDKPDWDQGAHGFNFMVQLYPCTAANCVWILPATHKLQHVDIRQMVADSGSDRIPGAIPMVCNAGDVCILNRQMVHGSFANSSSHRRITLNEGFHVRRRVLNQQVRQFSGKTVVYDEERVHERSRMIQIGIDARRQRFPDERSYVYQPLAAEADANRWSDETRETVVRDYNLRDMYI